MRTSDVSAGVICRAGVSAEGPSGATDVETFLAEYAVPDEFLSVPAHEHALAMSDPGVSEQRTLSCGLR